MSNQLSLAAFASAFALAALCLHAPALQSGTGGEPLVPGAVTAGIGMPAVDLPPFLTR